LFSRPSSFKKPVRNATLQDLMADRDLVRSIWRKGGEGYLKRLAVNDTPLFIITDDTSSSATSLKPSSTKLIEQSTRSQIPDPQDKNPQRYAILTVLTMLMARAFNHLIAKGLPRNAPSIIQDF
jgi:hypothetical protein